MENREKLTVMRRVRPEEKERVLTLVSDVFEIEQGIPRDMDDIPAEKSPQWWCIEISGRPFIQAFGTAIWAPTCCVGF